MEEMEEILEQYKEYIDCENIVEYIKRNKISVAQIEKDTGIHMSEFIDNNADFSAGEFLELCSYLHLDPKDMR